VSESTGPEPPPARRRLDPDAAAAAAGAEPTPHRPPPAAIDTRRYRWMIGIFGLTLVIAASIYQFAKNGVSSPGIVAGKRLHYFVAPLATSGLNLDANARPRCDPTRPNPKGLNVCGRTPLVLAFFVTGSGTCRREVDTLQALAPRYSASGIQFAAVAVRASAHDTSTLVRSHHWTIPVAYDRDGAIGALYGVEICPMLELAYRGGVVAARLIGEKWLNSSALASQVQRLL
jgi:Redoxin